MVQAPKIVPDGSDFKIDRNRFKLLEPVGKGAYGVVWAAEDKKTNELVAIKKIDHTFEHVTFTKRTLRELRLLRHLNHENVVNVKEVLMPTNIENFPHIYAVYELMETDLAYIIKSRQELTQDHNQFFLYQLLRGLKYLHSAGVIHRDLKPRNLLVNANCDLRICDFGLAKLDMERSQGAVKGGSKFCPPMTEYVTTRWYRAPEVLCSWPDYTEAIDVWSVGCILAELLNRKPLFPGTDTQNQLTLICHTMGTPSEEEVSRIQNRKCRDFLRLMRSKPKNLEHIFPNADPQAVDLVRRMLQFDPRKRITVEEALRHPYVAHLHCPDDEPTRDVLPALDFQFEVRAGVTMADLKDEVLTEMCHYHPEQAPTVMHAIEKRRIAKAKLQKMPSTSSLGNKDSLSNHSGKKLGRLDSEASVVSTVSTTASRANSIGSSVAECAPITETHDRLSKVKSGTSTVLSPPKGSKEAGPFSKLLSKATSWSFGSKINNYSVPHGRGRD